MAWAVFISPAELPEGRHRPFPGWLGIKITFTAADRSGHIRASAATQLTLEVSDVVGSGWRDR